MLPLQPAEVRALVSYLFGVCKKVKHKYDIIKIYCMIKMSPSSELSIDSYSRMMITILKLHLTGTLKGRLIRVKLITGRINHLHAKKCIGKFQWKQI